MPTASTPVTLASQSWTTAAPSTGGMGPGIAGMPAVANGGRGGSSFGAPRYGVKPKVMPTIPKPTAHLGIHAANAGRLNLNRNPINSRTGLDKWLSISQRDPRRSTPHSCTPAQERDH